MLGDIDFEYKEFKFSDLKRISFDGFNAGFRSENRVIRICKCEIMGTSKAVVIIAPPLNWAVWAIERMTNKSVIRSSNAFDDAAFNLYSGALSLAGVSRSDIHPLFLHEINNRPYFVGGDYKRLLSYSGEWLGEYRFIAHVVDVNFLHEVVSEFEMAIRDFGEYSLCYAPEGTDKIVKYQPWNYRFQEFDVLCLFVSPRHPGAGKDMRDFDQKVAMCKYALKEAIFELEAGRPVPWDIHYTILVRPPINLPYCGGLEPKFEKWEYVDFELLAMRCRLIRLLGWPQFFWSIGYRLDGEEWVSAMQYGTPEQRASMKAACGQFELPYDPLQELDAYMASTLKRYKTFQGDLKRI